MAGEYKIRFMDQTEDLFDNGDRDIGHYWFKETMFLKCTCGRVITRMVNKNKPVAVRWECPACDQHNYVKVRKQEHARV